MNLLSSKRNPNITFWFSHTKPMKAPHQDIIGLLKPLGFDLEEEVLHTSTDMEETLTTKLQQALTQLRTLT